MPVATSAKIVERDDPDGTGLFAGLATRGDAEAALDGHLATMNRKAAA